MVDEQSSVVDFRVKTQVNMFSPEDIEVDDSDSWCTPQWLCNLAYDYFGIPDLDPCTNKHAVMAARTKWTIADDCLSMPTWLVNGDGTTIYGQPPYSGPGAILDRLTLECKRGAHGIAMVKHDHSTEWWENQYKDVLAVAMLKRRVCHLLAGKAGKGGNFPSSILLMRSTHAKLGKFIEVYEPYAHIAVNPDRSDLDGIW